MPRHPLLVCLHGGGFDSRYFDAPSCSLLGRVSAAGFPIVALSRLGYPADDDSARKQPSFCQAAGIIAEAITDVWERLGADRPGVVLIGHSMGGAIATHMAAMKVSWPLIGLAISGVATTLSPFVVELVQQLPADIAMTLPSDVGRYVFYGPDWTLNAATLTEFEDLSVSMPSADGVELHSGWPDDLPKVAPLVEVPLHYVLAEFDRLWGDGDTDAFHTTASALPMWLLLTHFEPERQKWPGPTTTDGTWRRAWALRRRWSPLSARWHTVRS